PIPVAFRDRLRSFGNWLGGNEEEVTFAARSTPSTAVAERPVTSAVAVPVDELGRALVPSSRPITDRMYLPRVIDRRPQIQSPWTSAKIIGALRAADNGDLGPQSEFIEHMQDRDGAYLAFRQ